jgi:hypothetical protein
VVRTAARPMRLRERSLRAVAESRHRCVVHVEGPSDGTGALPLAKPLYGLLALMLVELWFATKRCASGRGGPPAVVRALDDALALVLGHGGEEGNEATANRRGEIQVRLVELCRPPNYAERARFPQDSR